MKNESTDGEEEKLTDSRSFHEELQQKIGKKWGKAKRNLATTTVFCDSKMLSVK